MRPLNLLVGLGAVSFAFGFPQEYTATIQKEDLTEQKYSIAVAAVGDKADTVAASEHILDGVERKLRSDAKIRTSGKRIVASRSELTNAHIWKYGREENADGVAVIQFESGTNGGKDSVYIWTSSALGPVPKKPTLVETVDKGGLREDQVSRIAAVVEQAASSGREVAVELYIRTVPARSLFTVGRSNSQSTDEKGVGLWIGTEEEGSVTVAASNEPNYEPAIQKVQLKQDPDQGIVRKEIKFNLKRRSGRKRP
jgi:hypothetical protein